MGNMPHPVDDEQGPPMESPQVESCPRCAEGWRKIGWPACNACLRKGDITEAIEHLEMFTDSGFYTLSNDHVRVIVSALRDALARL